MNLRKTIAVSAITLGLATSAMADSNLSGFYLGGNFGYATGKLDYNNHEPSPNNYKNDLKVSGPVLGLHVGYQHQINMFVLGVEGALNWGNTKKTIKPDVNGDSLSLEFRRDVAAGLAARLGIVISNVLVYTKLGWEVANFNVTIKENNITQISKNKSANAFVAGLGVEKVFNNGFMLGGEWSYAMYKEKSLFNEIEKDTFKPRIHDFKIRLGYKFSF